MSRHAAPYDEPCLANDAEHGGREAQRRRRAGATESLPLLPELVESIAWLVSDGLLFSLVNNGQTRPAEQGNIDDWRMALTHLNSMALVCTAWHATIPWAKIWRRFHPDDIKWWPCCCTDSFHARLCYHMAPYRKSPRYLQWNEAEWADVQRDYYCFYQRLPSLNMVLPYVLGWRHPFDKPIFLARMTKLGLDYASLPNMDFEHHVKMRYEQAFDKPLTVIRLTAYWCQDCGRYEKVTWATSTEMLIRLFDRWRSNTVMFATRICPYRIHPLTLVAAKGEEEAEDED